MSLAVRNRAGIPLLQAVALLVLAVAVFAPQAQAFDHHHKIFTKQLKRFVDNSGCVNYEQWQKSKSGLDSYLKLLAAVNAKQYTAFTAEQKKAFWVNAYNALAIKLVLDHFPLKAGQDKRYPPVSIRQIPNCWEAVKLNVADRDVDLYSIEHMILRRELHDVRCQFAVVPAALGGARLKRSAYDAVLIDKQLDQATAEFLAEKRNLSWDEQKKTISVSQIFNWFPLDFCTSVPIMGGLPPDDDEIVFQYLEKYLPSAMKEGKKASDFKIIYDEYDWTLNACKAHG